MKKIRILSGLLVVVLVMIMMSSSVFAVSDEKEVLSNVPYGYGVVPFSNEYKNMSLEQQRKIFSISKETAEGLTTEALLESILNNPFIVDLLVYNDFVEAVKNRDNQFQIIEFLNRKDSYIVINDFLIKYDSILKNETTFNYNSLIDVKNIVIEDKNIAFDYVKIDFLYRLKENGFNIITNNIEIQNRGMEWSVFTKNLIEVPCILNQTWDDLNSSELAAIAKFVILKNTYSSAVEVAGVNPSYNCHSYAWHFSRPDNNVWISDSNMVNYLIEAQGVETNLEVGDKVTYFYNGSYIHSAVVYEIDTSILDGLYTGVKVISKWGSSGLMIHDIGVCPYLFNEITFWKY